MRRAPARIGNLACWTEVVDQPSGHLSLRIDEITDDVPYQRRRCLSRVIVVPLAPLVIDTPNPTPRSNPYGNMIRLVDRLPRFLRDQTLAPQELRLPPFVPFASGAWSLIFWVQSSPNVTNAALRIGSEIAGTFGCWQVQVSVIILRPQHAGISRWPVDEEGRLRVLFFTADNSSATKRRGESSPNSTACLYHLFEPVH